MTQLTEIHSEIGLLLYQQLQFDEAIAHLTIAAQLKPTQYEVFLRLGLCYQKKKDLSFDVTAFVQARSICLENIEPLEVLNIIQQRTSNLEKAILCFKQAISLNPDEAESYTNIGALLKELGRFTEAISYYQKSLLLDEMLPETYSNLGNTLLAKGCFPEALAAHRQAIQIRPLFPGGHSDLLRTLNYHPEISNELLFEEHQRWAIQQTAHIAARANHTNFPDPERPLKIGYLSPDLREHSVAFFLESLLAHHDHNAVEIVCYAEVQYPDKITERFQKLADAFHFICALSDEQVAKKIQEDEIDILIDLAGHTCSNRLNVFAYKPAPVQITYLGYPGTTGLPQMDYRLTDTWADPLDQEAFHSEILLRLQSGFLCYLPPENAPETVLPPYFERKFITFGCFNNMSKINEPVIALWSRILKAVPESYLLLKNFSLIDEAIKDRYYMLFSQNGIPPERLIFRDPLGNNNEHLELYGQVDIALDPFPYNGTTTTCEALWMGVPVITLAGQRHASRVGVSLLSQLNLQELIASSESEYVECAVKLAQNPEQLTDFRHSIRFWMAASPLCDGEAFARQLEGVYRQVWQKWCAYG